MPRFYRWNYRAGFLAPDGSAEVEAGVTRAPAFPKLLLGGIGMILGLIALGVAFLSPEIAGMIDLRYCRSG